VGLGIREPGTNPISQFRAPSCSNAVAVAVAVADSNSTNTSFIQSWRWLHLILTPSRMPTLLKKRYRIAYSQCKH